MKAKGSVCSGGSVNLHWRRREHLACDEEGVSMRGGKEARFTLLTCWRFPSSVFL